MVVAPLEQPIVAAPRRGAARIAAIYVTVGLAWITGSDHVLATLFAEQHIAIAQTLKGYAYVLLTGYFLYVAIARLVASAASTQQRLTQSETAYRNLFESHPHPMFVYDLDTLRFLAVNQAALAKYGYTRAELLALTLHDLRPPDEFDEFHRALNAHKYFDALLEYGPVRHWTKDRRLLDMQISTNTLEFDGNHSARVVLALDVTERVRAERVLHDAQRHFKEMERLARVGWWSIDRASDEMMLSEQMQNLVAIDRAAPATTKDMLFQRVHPDDREALRQAYDRAWQGLPLQLEIRVVRADNAIVWLWLRGELNTQADAGTEQLIGTALDVTTRKQIERDIQQSETQYRRLIDYLPEAVLVHCDARVTFVNPAAVVLLGAARASDLLGQSVEQFIAAPSRAAARERFAALHGPDADMGFQERLLKKINGEVFTAEVAVQPVMIDGRHCVQAVVRDIGVQKKMQMELQLANERLLHLSAHMTEASENERRQLSRELHDDLGQALTFIKMTTAWLRKRVTAELAERIDQINAVAGDALAKVRDLALALRPAQLEALGLKAAMEEHIQRFCAGSGIEYAMQLQQLDPRPQPTLEIALFRIFQEALTNIFRHAGANFIEVALARRDGAIVLRVVDDGRGFDANAALSVGTGFGLHSMVERAQQLQGTLQWHSVAGVGTELIAIIPEPAV